MYLGNIVIAHIESANNPVYYDHRDRTSHRQPRPAGGVDSRLLTALLLKQYESEGVVGNNWRFPRPYVDGESGYYYNYFRDYDPELGRQLQSSPIA